MGIYALIFKTKKQVYIGQSKNITTRVKQHLSDLNSTAHSNKKVQNYYNKYGKNDLVVCQVLNCSIDLLDDIEIKLIAIFKRLGNSLNSEHGGNKNKTLSEEHRQKISAKAKGRPSPNLGKIASKELLQRLSDSHKGIPSPKKGISTGKPAWNSGCVGVQESTRRLKVVATHKITGVNLGIYDSISAFQAAINYKSKNYIKLLDGTRILGNYILKEI